ncbi:hypothetical protein IIA28_05720 [candidate division KSB1 bacterium]|nr:hypothetical protein [candidate division KSB1 bacterium]
MDLDFKAHLESHGRYGERHQDIITRIMGDKWKVSSGDNKGEKYSKDDVDSRKTKKKRRLEK